MAIKRKKTGTSSHAEDVDAEGTRNEASLEASSHENQSAYLTREEMDGVLAELRTQMARQDDLLRKQQEMIDQFFTRMEGRPSGNTQLAGNNMESAPAEATNRIGSDPIRTGGTERTRGNPPPQSAAAILNVLDGNVADN